MDEIIVKYLTDSISDEELKTLYNWLQKDDNKEIFKTYIKSNHYVSLLSNDFKVEDSFKRIEEHVSLKVKKLRPKQKKIKWPYYAAASVAILIGSILFFNQTDELHDYKSAPISIELDNGKKIFLNDTDAKIKVGANTYANQKSNEHKLNYYNKASAHKKNKLSYNTITIPYGEKFQLILSDSTIVHLNAGASLRFPISFAEGSRDVSVTGEAFFEVSKDTSRPFIVKTEEITVQVLGTKFNISDYGHQEGTEVVLVEGAVKMQDHDLKKSQILKPGERGLYDQKLKSMVKETVQTELYTSWLSGKLIFRNRSFDEILKALERNFNVRIVNNNTSLREDKFNAAFDKNVSLQKVLFYFEEAYDINYIIEEDKITIN